MRLLLTSLRGASSPLLSTLSLLLFAAPTTALRMLQSTSLSPCMPDSGLVASKFNVTFTPDDKNLRIEIDAASKIEGNVKAKVTVLAYGFNVMEIDLDPCEQVELKEQMCPLAETPDLRFAMDHAIDLESLEDVPGIAYTIPDLDGVARMEVFSSDTGERLACVDAPMTNRYTVDQDGVRWTTAVITGLALLISAIISGLGHSWTAAHVAANALSLFYYFQSQAMVSLAAVPLPPLTASWVQNFDWSMGIIRIGFMQRVLHWYIEATGGNPSNLKEQQSELSVIVSKRDTIPMPRSSNAGRAAMWGFEDYPAPSTSLVKRVGNFLAEQTGSLLRRSNNAALSDSPDPIRVTGIERMSYKARIEHTNFFMTGLSFFIIFLCFVTLLLLLFRFLLLPLFKHSSFRDFRARWQVILRGVMYRLMLIGFPQMMILCPWEWTAKDSPAAVVQAVFFFIAMLGIMVWACYKVLTLGLSSRKIAGDNPDLRAYKLYNDPAALNRWGYLYTPFKRQAFYFIIVFLVYTLLKSFFIALMQPVGRAQSVVLLITEFFYLLAVILLRPWLDKRTNIVNIAIAVINFVNAICLLIFSGITKLPEPAHGVTGILFFVMNAIFTLILLIVVLVSAATAVFSKNPEKRFRGVGGAPVDEKGVHTPPLRDLDADDSLGAIKPIGEERRESVNTEQAMSIRHQPTAGRDMTRSIVGELTPGAGAARSGSTRSERTAVSSLGPHTRDSEGVAQRPVDWQSGAGYERA